MQPHEYSKEDLVDSLLESLHYRKAKEDIGLIEELREALHIPRERELRAYLVDEIDFSELFAQLLQLAAPFAKMMSDIYAFLAGQRATAASPKQLIVGETVHDKISFDLEVFRDLYQPVIRQMQGYLREYDLDQVLGGNCSPIPYIEHLLACGHCTDPHYHKSEECQECGLALRTQFGKVLQQYDQLIGIIPDEAKKQSYMYSHFTYFDKGKENFFQGVHFDRPCMGYRFWKETLDKIEKRFDLVSVKKIGTYDVTVLIHFFELPFWQERSRLYEVWTLTHFINLLRGVTCDLNIQDGQWRLIYENAEEPVARVRGEHFEIEIWYQRKLKARGVFDADVTPEMLFFYRERDGVPEPLVLIECKERKNNAVRESYERASFYRAQIRSALNIFCNYYDYAPAQGVKVSNDTPPIILVDRFQPGSVTVDIIDREFMRLMNERLGVFLQTVLIDVSGSMQHRDIQEVYRQLDGYLSQLPGSKSLSATFADKITFVEPDRLAAVLHHLSIGGTTALRDALQQLQARLQQDTPETSVCNFYIITDLGFDQEDWTWLDSVDAGGSYNITFVTRRDWWEDHARERVGRFKRTEVLFF